MKNSDSVRISLQPADVEVAAPQPAPEAGLIGFEVRGPEADPLVAVVGDPLALLRPEQWRRAL